MKLNRAGLVDGRPVTTHWRHAATFRERFPRVVTDIDRLLVDLGDIVTAGGVNGVDPILRLRIKERHQQKHARRTVTCPCEAVWVGHVANDGLGTKGKQIWGLFICAQKNPHAMACSDELPRDRAALGAGSTVNENVGHGIPPV
jgi:ligand-binding SRPBCC domain-containing protein